MGNFKVEIDKKACQGFGACIELCPKFFKLSEVDGKSSFLAEGAKKVKKNDEIVMETLDLDELKCAVEGAEACPFKAIHITKVETGEKLV